MSKQWYLANTSNDQGLIIDEQTGKNSALEFRKGEVMKKGVYWVVMCADGHGWDYVYDGLWGYETRIYSTKKGAERHMRKLRNDKCWRDTNPRCDQDDERYDPKYDWRQDIPEFRVKQMTVEEIEDAGGALLQDLEKTARGEL